MAGKSPKKKTGMVMGLRRMACGNCGNGSFGLAFTGEDSHYPKTLHVECRKCKSTTVIGTNPAKIMLSWGEGADGIVCDMEPSSNV